MNVTCPECRSVFRVDPAKVPATGVRARCSVCGGVMAIAGGTLPVAVTPASPSASVPAFPGGVSRATPAAAASPAPAMASDQAPRGTPTSSRAMTPAGGPVVPARNTPVYAPPLRRVTPIANAVVASVATPAAPPTASVTPIATARHATPHAGTPIGSPVMATPRSATPARSVGTPSGGKRPINPFLRADPAERSRRLARALVSDLVAYQPRKREEGLRDGTLRQLFREEIKKSYEEYVEQVGREVAEQSPHFQDALNEILAGGRRLF